VGAARAVSGEETEAEVEEILELVRGSSIESSGTPLGGPAAFYRW
jgi:hypothetical protein